MRRAATVWPRTMGPRAILQRPDAMLGAPPRTDGGETYLMLFVDGSRIDLTLLPANAMATFRYDGPAEVLLDHDAAVPPRPPADAPHHAPEPPTAAAFADVCNEFWWVAAASGFRRGPGKHGRNLERELSAGRWARLEATYADADPAHAWDALDAMTGLFRDVAVEVAARFAFAYPWSDDRQVTAHVRRIQDGVAGEGPRP